MCIRDRCIGDIDIIDAVRNANCEEKEDDDTDGNENGVEVKEAVSYTHLLWEVIKMGDESPPQNHAKYDPGASLL